MVVAMVVPSTPRRRRRWGLAVLGLTCAVIVVFLFFIISTVSHVAPRAGGPAEPGVAPPRSQLRPEDAAAATTRQGPPEDPAGASGPHGAGRSNLDERPAMPRSGSAARERAPDEDDHALVGGTVAVAGRASAPPAGLDRRGEARLPRSPLMEAVGILKPAAIPSSRPPAPATAGKTQPATLSTTVRDDDDDDSESTTPAAAAVRELPRLPVAIVPIHVPDPPAPASPSPEARRATGDTTSPSSSSLSPATQPSFFRAAEGPCRAPVVPEDVQTILVEGLYDHRDTVSPTFLQDRARSSSSSSSSSTSSSLASSGSSSSEVPDYSMCGIPRLVHLVFGLRSGPEAPPMELELFHFLTIRSIVERLRPERIYLYHYARFTGHWWEAIRPWVTPRFVVPPSSFQGRLVAHFAHKADILRLQLLLAYGGVYLDMDVVIAQSLDAVLDAPGADVVMGEEGVNAEVGLCNAVILARPHAPFLRRWLAEYRDFDGRDWNAHSVRLPRRLALQHPGEVRVLRHDAAFFWPLWNERGLRAGYSSAQTDFDRGLSLGWHLWESRAVDAVLRTLSPREILLRDTSFNCLVRNLVREWGPTRPCVPHNTWLGPVRSDGARDLWEREGPRIRQRVLTPIAHWHLHPAEFTGIAWSESALDPRGSSSGAAADLPRALVHGPSSFAPPSTSTPARERPSRFLRGSEVWTAPVVDVVGVGVESSRHLPGRDFGPMFWLSNGTLVTEAGVMRSSSSKDEDDVHSSSSSSSSSSTTTTSSSIFSSDPLGRHFLRLRPEQRSGLHLPLSAQTRMSDGDFSVLFWFRARPEDASTAKRRKHCSMRGDGNPVKDGAATMDRPDVLAAQEEARRRAAADDDEDGADDAAQFPFSSLLEEAEDLSFCEPETLLSIAYPDRQLVLELVRGPGNMQRLQVALLMGYERPFRILVTSTPWSTSAFRRDGEHLSLDGWRHVSLWSRVEACPEVAGSVDASFDYPLGREHTTAYFIDPQRFPERTQLCLRVALLVNGVAMKDSVRNGWIDPNWVLCGWAANLVPLFHSNSFGLRTDLNASELWLGTRAQKLFDHAPDPTNRFDGDFDDVHLLSGLPSINQVREIMGSVLPSWLVDGVQFADVAQGASAFSLIGRETDADDSIRAYEWAKPVPVGTPAVVEVRLRTETGPLTKDLVNLVLATAQHDLSRSDCDVGVDHFDLDKNERSAGGTSPSGTSSAPPSTRWVVSCDKAGSLDWLLRLPAQDGELRLRIRVTFAAPPSSSTNALSPLANLLWSQPHVRFDARVPGIGDVWGRFHQYQTNRPGEGNAHLWQISPLGFEAVIPSADGLRVGPGSLLVLAREKYLAEPESQASDRRFSADLRVRWEFLSEAEEDASASERDWTRTSTGRTLKALHSRSSRAATQAPTTPSTSSSSSSSASASASTRRQMAAQAPTPAFLDALARFPTVLMTFSFDHPLEWTFTPEGIPPSSPPWAVDFAVVLVRAVDPARGAYPALMVHPAEWQNWVNHPFALCDECIMPTFDTAALLDLGTTNHVQLCMDDNFVSLFVNGERYSSGMLRVRSKDGPRRQIRSVVIGADSIERAFPEEQATGPEPSILSYRGDVGMADDSAQDDDQEQTAEAQKLVEDVRAWRVVRARTLVVQSVALFPLCLCDLSRTAKRLNPPAVEAVLRSARALLPRGSSLDNWAAQAAREGPAGAPATLRLPHSSQKPRWSLLDASAGPRNRPVVSESATVSEVLVQAGATASRWEVVGEAAVAGVSIESAVLASSAWRVRVAYECRRSGHERVSLWASVDGQPRSLVARWWKLCVAPPNAILDVDPLVFGPTYSLIDARNVTRLSTPRATRQAVGCVGTLEPSSHVPGLVDERDETDDGTEAVSGQPARTRCGTTVDELSAKVRAALSAVRLERLVCTKRLVGSPPTPVSVAIVTDGPDPLDDWSTPTSFLNQLATYLAGSSFTMSCPTGFVARPIRVSIVDITGWIRAQSRGARSRIERAWAQRGVHYVSLGFSDDWIYRYQASWFVIAAYQLHQWLKQQTASHRLIDLCIASVRRGSLHFAAMAKDAGLAHKSTTFVTVLDRPSLWVVRSRAEFATVEDLQADAMERAVVSRSDRVLAFAPALRWVAKEEWDLDPNSVIQVGEEAFASVALNRKPTPQWTAVGESLMAAGNWTAFELARMHRPQSPNGPTSVVLVFPFSRIDHAEGLETAADVIDSLHEWIIEESVSPATDGGRAAANAVDLTRIAFHAVFVGHGARLLPTGRRAAPANPPKPSFETSADFLRERGSRWTLISWSMVDPTALRAPTVKSNGTQLHVSSLVESFLDALVGSRAMLILPAAVDHGGGVAIRWQSQWAPRQLGPIIASDLPAHRSLAAASSITLVEPRGQSIAEAIRSALATAARTPARSRLESAERGRKNATTFAQELSRTLLLDAMDRGERVRATLLAEMQTILAKSSPASLASFRQIVSPEVRTIAPSFTGRALIEAHWPLVSVVVATFNRPSLLRHAIWSLRRQTYPRLEIVLVDDASTDPIALDLLEDIEAEFEGSINQVVRLPHNAYLGAARNAGIRAARGDLIAILDDDNIARPEEITILVNALISYDADIVTCTAAIWHSTGFPSSTEPVREVWMPLGEARGPSVFRNSFGDANSLFRRAAWEAVGGYSELRGVGTEDVEFFAKAALRGLRVRTVPEPLYWYRASQGGMQHSRARSRVRSQFDLLRFGDQFGAEVDPDLRGVMEAAQGLASAGFWRPTEVEDVE